MSTKNRKSGKKHAIAQPRIKPEKKGASIYDLYQAGCNFLAIAPPAIYITNAVFDSPFKENFQQHPIMTTAGALMISAGVSNWLYNLKKIFFDYKKKGEKKLITDGQYSFSRNPIYDSWRIASLGAVGYNPSVPQMVGCGLTYLFTELCAAVEEKQLERHFGQEYREYKNKVPRWATDHIVNSFYDEV
jgi:protein-S-isoprenylcysteine O-methyltransferase Ste14